MEILMCCSRSGRSKCSRAKYIRKMSSVLISLDLLDSSGSSISKTENCILICLESRERLQIVLGLFGDFNLILA
jgi:hypothetical protein